MLAFLRARIQEILEQRKTLAAERDAITEKVQAEKRGELNDEETKLFNEKRAAIKALDAEFDEKRARVAELEEDEKREQAANAALAAAGQTGQRRSGGAIITSEPQAYGRGSGHSYFLDLARSTANQGDGDGGPTAARDRLTRHQKELDVELPARAARQDARADSELRSQFGQGAGFEKRVNPNRTDGQGGYAVPPLWLVDELVPYLRAGRTFVNTFRQLTLPGGTDSINIPKILTGTATAIQTADAAAVQSTDLTDTFLTAPVRTIAGQQDIALQLLDQSPINFDEIVMVDLLADYNQKLDVQGYYGSGVSGQVKGATIVAGINAVTYTDASPTGPELYVPLMQAISKIAGQRFLPPTGLFFHPRRWYWLASQLDSSNRPLVVPSQPQEFNPLGMQTGVVSEGPVGYVGGLPVFLDPNITAAGLAGAQTGGTEDQIIAARTSDLFLWEGNLRTRTLSEVLSGTLQVRIQVWNYVAAMCDRYPVSISVVSGTGMQAPAGF